MKERHLDESTYEKLLRALAKAPATRARLETPKRLIFEGRSDKETVLKNLFPDKSREEALTDFRQFKSRVNKKAKDTRFPSQ